MCSYEREILPKDIPELVKVPVTMAKQVIKSFPPRASKKIKNTNSVINAVVNENKDMIIELSIGLLLYFNGLIN